MKKLCLILISFLLIQNSNAQEYISFPTEDAQWNGFAFTYVPHMFSSITNYHYVINGDTLINSQEYSKLYYEDVVWSQDDGYLGAIRENENQQIFFFPSVSSSSAANYEFPGINEEFLLYDFNNLTVGMNIDINSHYDSTIVVGMDSIFLNEEFRKVYFVQYYMNNWPQMIDMWIEGIGSQHDLFNPFIDWFPGETNWYTLCFTDEDGDTFYINSPNGEDSCHYFINVGIEEIQNQISIYPNPAKDLIKIEMDQDQGFVDISILNLHGQAILNKNSSNPITEIEIGSLERGIYFLEISFRDEKLIKKFIKI